jgi:glycosyltransferase involved in cell wall biosynthesis
LLDAASVAEEFRQADVFVLPSRNEGLPVALIEAMSHGCAIVSTPVGSIADAIISEQTGLLVDIGDSDALAKALFRLVESRELRVRLGAAARTKFAASFTLPNYISELHAVYENVSLQPVATRGVRYQRPIM